jgi:poly-gamma-glutamate synthesis protein (capsule biosynthesis protein)
MKYGSRSVSDYKALGEEIAALRQAGAEFIVVFIHWGSEYKLKGNSAQRDSAKRIADLGADLIIGAHPHVLQNVDEYASPVTGKNVLIYYSLGNLVSNMHYNHGPGGGNCETGALALIRLERSDDGSASIESAGYLTTYVHKPNVTRVYSEGGRQYSKTVRAYYIVPAEAAAANPATYRDAAGSLLDRITKGAYNGDNVIGKSGKELTLFKFCEYTVFPWGTHRSHEMIIRKHRNSLLSTE